jgi:predicted murein hydrolase (TIGR00659 family)
MGWIMITVILYLLAAKMYSRFPSPFTLPVLTVTAVLICLFLTFGISHDDYKENGGKWISELLNPAIVSLAIPLFKQRHILMKHFLSILTGVAAGIIALMIVNISIGKILHIDKELILTSIPQLTTMPIAVSLADQIGGIPSMTAVFVVIAGITGAIAGPVILKFFHITSMIGRGVGMGCASHIIGVTRMLKESEDEAMIGSVTMIVTGLLTSILVPYGLHLLF